MIIEIEYRGISVYRWVWEANLDGGKRKDKHEALRPTHFPAHNLCDMAISESELVRQ